jgi:predicted Zn-ribbon and HTH transcriptional regulator
MMTDEDRKQSLEEWMAEERARLKKGFEYTPKPVTSSGPTPADEALTGLGIGAGVVGGAVAPHPNPTVFEGVKAAIIADALESELSDEDARVQVTRTGDSTMVTILLSQADGYQFLPALTVTLLETADKLTVTMGDLDKDVVRGAWASIGGEVVEQGKDLLLGRRGIAGMLDAAGDLIESVSDVAESVDDLALPKQAWKVIDRVGKAAEEAYLEAKRREQEAQRQREAIERAWTHCPACGRAYRPEEIERVDCPSCGAPRGDRPDWL